ncbi:WbqC family protein [Paraflavitalea devenefica]|uniref:WbqC family protein n=1 Tax=Paraflavitalea devenefica TaxID=2716334 RepID=UPI001ABA72C1|nr:WbqC family protein [Paraflavitalea devenefica]
MQPYFFPYIAYYQMVKAVDRFVFYDDVNYIKGGWINRNRILINGIPSYINVIMKNASPFKHIDEIIVNDRIQWKDKLLKSIRLNYAKAPFLKEVFPLVASVVYIKSNRLVDYSRKSIEEVMAYLEIKKDFVESSKIYNNAHLKSIERILDICRQSNSTEYINLIGGRSLYNKELFKEHGVDLFFIDSGIVTYPQFKRYFVPHLSIIDVLMFNPKEQVINMLDKYRLA